MIKRYCDICGKLALPDLPISIESELPDPFKGDYAVAETSFYIDARASSTIERHKHLDLCRSCRIEQIEKLLQKAKKQRTTQD